LRNISEKHLLLVVFFENTSLYSLSSGEAKNIEGLYEKVIAEKFILEKKLIVKELQKYGIPALLTAPEKLSVDVVNKYLQIKARREI
jgi:CRISPR/Cas system-associated protein Cas7 (RAMP superfamily)